MLANCHSACVRGVHGEPTEVEVHLRKGNPRFDVVGLPDAAGREARDRVRSAILSSGYEFPTGHVVVNLAPLRELVPWGEPAKVWKKLEAGDYDWAMTAMRHWPDRVREKCQSDKSLAIAHEPSAAKTPS